MDGITLAELLKIAPQMAIAVLILVVVIYFSKQARIDRKECADSITASSKLIVEAIKESSAQNAANHASTREDLKAHGLGIARISEEMVRSSEIARQLDANTRLLSSSLASISDIHDALREIREHSVRVDANVMRLTDLVEKRVA